MEGFYGDITFIILTNDVENIAKIQNIPILPLSIH